MKLLVTLMLLLLGVPLAAQTTPAPVTGDTFTVKMGGQGGGRFAPADSRSAFGPPLDGSVTRRFGARTCSSATSSGAYRPRA